MKLLGKITRDKYWGGVPNDARSHTVISNQHGMSSSVEHFHIAFSNDAHDMHIWRKFSDDDGRYVLMLSQHDFRKMALWYIWRWIIGDWLGLRSWLYFKYIKWSVARMRGSG